MKQELAVRLLQDTVPGFADEARASSVVRQLEFLASYKYNKYEMYHPGRLFLENLAIWLQQFDRDDRDGALDFVLHDLIFISRAEFQQLAAVLHDDVIKVTQLDVTAKITGIPRHKLKAIVETQEFAKVRDACLYIGLSDGARIDYVRRHNLSITNEQVLPYYETSRSKIDRILNDLGKRIGEPGAKFKCLYLMDDFCGSGKTLLREVISVPLANSSGPPSIPDDWSARLSFDDLSEELEWQYDGPISDPDQDRLRHIGKGKAFEGAVATLVHKAQQRDTTLKGSLLNLSEGDLKDCVDGQTSIYLCPLVATEYAIERLSGLTARLSGPFAQMEIRAASQLDSSRNINSTETPVGALCEKLYSDVFADRHTGNVKFGYDGCGLPLVLHHNTPNNSIYLLWARRNPSFSPLFVRYERHGRERG